MRNSCPGSLGSRIIRPIWLLYLIAIFVPLSATGTPSESVLDHLVDRRWVSRRGTYSDIIELRSDGTYIRVVLDGRDSGRSETGTWYLSKVVLPAIKVDSGIIFLHSEHGRESSLIYDSEIGMLCVTERFLCYTVDDGRLPMRRI